MALAAANKIPKTGRLTHAPAHTERLGMRYHACVDCDTMYPVVIEYEDYQPVEEIKCNGHVITLCPWCRPDTKPWENGRGL